MPSCKPFSDPEPEPEPEPTPPETLNSVSFNHNLTLITVATSTGIRVLGVSPYAELFRRTFHPGGISVAHTLFRRRYIAMHGKYYPPNKVMIFDCSVSRPAGEIELNSPVISVRLLRDHIFVVVLFKIVIYTFEEFKHLHTIETMENPKGLCEVSTDATSAVVVCPGTRKGEVRVEKYENYRSSWRTRVIAAHRSNLNCLGLTRNGRYLATASTKGTLIRVFNALDGTLLQEVRRGTEKAEIHSLAFSFDGRWLAVSSDRGTVHVFSLKLDYGSPVPVNNGQRSLAEQPSYLRSSMSYIPSVKGVLPKYFSSEWSLAQFHLKEGIKYTVVFSREENTVMILGMDGSYYRCEFDPVSGGEMTQLEFHNFMEQENLPQSYPSYS